MRNLSKKLFTLILAVILAISGIGIPGGVYAADAVAFPRKAISYTLGEGITFSVGESDYILVDGYSEHGKVYKFTMPKQGILRLFVDEPNWNRWYYYFYSVSDANTRLSEVYSGSKKDIEYNNATGSYQMTAETALDAGEYYVIIDSGIISDPIKLTMSYIEPTISVSAITLNATQVNLDKGKQYALTASISPTNASNKDIIWKSEDPSVATVDNGLVTAVGYGTTKITASSADGGASASCVVNVPIADVPVMSVSLSSPSFTLTVGQSRTITATVNPSNATQRGIVWTSSAPEVATVSGGIITARSAGVTKITASSTDGVHKASITVTVNGADRSNEIATIKKAKPSINVLKAGKKKVTLKFKKTSVKNMKYEIAYRKGSGKWQTVKVSASSKTIGKLTSKKSYSFRVRGYKTINGNTYYTKWSGIKRIKVK
jgi:uncharacterized protein YjdB